MLTVFKLLLTIVVFVLPGILPCAASSASAAIIGYRPHWVSPTSPNAKKRWSYAAVYFKQGNDLAQGLHIATWDPSSKMWVATVPGKGTLRMTATQQSMTEGNALFSARIWTSDRDYACVIIESQLHATVPVGVRLVRIDAAKNPRQQRLMTRFVSPNMIKEAKGQCDQQINAIVRDIHKGDRICFLLTNSGVGSGSFVLQTWPLRILGLPPLPSGSAHHSR